MLDLKRVRAEPARVKAGLARRGMPAAAVDAVLDLDALWTERAEVCEALRLRRRRAAEEGAHLRAAGTDTEDLDVLGRTLGDELAAVERQMADLDTRRLAALLALPNLPASDTPDELAPWKIGGPRSVVAANGQQQPDATERVPPETPPEEAPAWREPFAPLPHWDLMERLGLAAPAAGPGLGRGWLVWRGRGAHLVRALTDFMLTVHTREFGCEEVRAPVVTSRAALEGSAHLPLLEDKMYSICEPDAGASGYPLPEQASALPTDLFLSPRAEPHLAALYAGCTFDASALPVRLVSAGPALRREAAPHGAAAKGLLRLHQFDTVELYTFCRPEDDEAELARAVAAAETILDRLAVPHRKCLRPAPDLSHAAAKTVDLEVWAPGTGQWLAVAAISAFTDYQARRTDTRFRDAPRRVRPVHTLGGAAVALPHLIAAILENGQQADVSVRLPEALGPYMDGATCLNISH